MSRCDVPLEVLSAIVDGELAGSEELRVRRHADECAFCASRLAVLKALKTATARAAEVHPVPPSLREALRPRASTRHGGRYKVALSFAAALVLAGVVIGIMSWRARRPLSVASELVADYARYAAAPNAAEYATTDRDALSEWLSRRVGFVVDLPSLEGARVTGGRPCTIAGHLSALAFYQRGERRVSVFVLPSGTIPAAERRQFQTAGAAEEAACLEHGAGYRLCLRPEEASDVVVVEPQGSAPKT